MHCVYALNTPDGVFCYQEPYVLQGVLERDKKLTEPGCFISRYWVEPLIPSSFVEGFSLELLKDMTVVDSVSLDVSFKNIPAASFHEESLDLFDVPVSCDIDILCSLLENFSERYMPILMNAISCLLAKGFDHFRTIDLEKLNPSIIDEEFCGTDVPYLSFSRSERVLILKNARFIAMGIEKPESFIIFAQLFNLYNPNLYGYIPSDQLVDAINAAGCSKRSMSQINKYLIKRNGVEGSTFLDENGQLRPCYIKAKEQTHDNQN